MLWNSLYSARAALKIPGIVQPLQSCGAGLEGFSFAGLGRNQLWFVVLPCSRCSVKSMVRACLQYQGSLGSVWEWQRAHVLQLHCGAMPRQISWDNPLLGAANLWLSPGGDAAWLV